MKNPTNLKFYDDRTMHNVTAYRRSVDLFGDNNNQRAGNAWHEQLKIYCSIHLTSFNIGILNQISQNLAISQALLILKRKYVVILKLACITSFVQSP